MIREDFYFDSRDGESEIHAVRFLPEDDKAIRGVIQVVHGMCEHVGKYTEFAKFMTEHGFVVTGEDHLGHGKSVEGIAGLGYFCEQDPATVLVRDVHRLKKTTDSDYPNVPYIILGHSMGSYIVRNYLMRYGSGIDAAIILGTGMQPQGLLKLGKAVAKVQTVLGLGARKGRFLHKLSFNSYNARIQSPKSPSDWLSRDGKKVREYLADPLCGFMFTVNGFGALYELIDRLYDEEALQNISSGLPVLMASGDADPVGEYGAGVRRAYDSLQAAGMSNVELRLYEGARHELLNETNRKQVMQDILEWLEDTVL